MRNDCDRWRSKAEKTRRAATPGEDITQREAHVKQFSSLPYREAVASNIKYEQALIRGSASFAASVHRRQQSIRSVGQWGKAVREPRPTKSLITNHSFFAIAACAAARRATGKRNGLQLT
jgi:hypothetical protein